jgi:hypothetical protein
MILLIIEQIMKQSTQPLPSIIRNKHKQANHFINYSKQYSLSDVNLSLHWPPDNKTQTEEKSIIAIFSFKN